VSATVGTHGDRIATGYTGSPYPREEERVVAVIEAERQTVGIG
jgi:hypothetical protein